MDLDEATRDAVFAAAAEATDWQRIGKGLHTCIEHEGWTYSVTAYWDTCSTIDFRTEGGIKSPDAQFVRRENVTATASWGQSAEISATAVRLVLR